MKILITRNGEKIGVHHDPKEVVSNPKANTVFIRDVNSKKPPTVYHVKSRNLTWFSCDDSDEEEILVEFEVK